MKLTTDGQRGSSTRASGGWVDLLGESYYRIAHIDAMPVFLMSIVSASDHWLFVASNGGLTAGRSNADSALFPYETEDKIAANRDHTGSVTAIRLLTPDGVRVWRPFSDACERRCRVERDLYRNAAGTAVIFEETNYDLELRLRLRWTTSERHGFVRTAWLTNLGGTTTTVDLLDGIRNILPYGATKATQTQLSSLLDAYKRCELDESSGVGIFSLSATLTDRAEPSESLMATVAWQIGLDGATPLVTARQVGSFINGGAVRAEHDVCGAAGSYLHAGTVTLTAGEERRWDVIADVNQDGAAVADLCDRRAAGTDGLVAEIEAEIAANRDALVALVARADGAQLSGNRATATHHFANVMFNVMRGGIPLAGHDVPRADLIDFVATRNRPTLETNRAWFEALPHTIALPELHARADASGDVDVMRIAREYLPITFSRRHGDPSRPWNSFSINLKRADGSPRLDYQGNWRDIFQNWEPLVVSFPAFAESVIAKFLNATTIDGYNPYRVTRDGIEWEVPEPDNPWSNIGYWSDHQIIYLQKLLEVAEERSPGTFRRLGNAPIFATANVPYRIRSYERILADWYDTIDFDAASDRAIADAVETMGTDARLHRDADGAVVHVTMAEKLLVLLLAKLTNVVPGGGIWMNTQRPEWNDANNALVGKGLSVVTAAYLRRFVRFWVERLDEAADESVVRVSQPLADLFAAVEGVLTSFAPREAAHSGARRAFMDRMGEAITAYRSTVYRDGLRSASATIGQARLRALLGVALDHIDATLAANRRPDGLFHSYNTLTIAGADAAVEHLYPMLEGQVAILSSGVLSSDEAARLLRALRTSDLYRADQHSYMLYPHRTLPGFRVKNAIPAQRAAAVPLLQLMVERGDRRLVSADAAGTLHFNGRFRNAADVEGTLATLALESAYAAAVESDRAAVLALFEEVFNHRQFTGRSGTFFAYEGLGSIYWHMVSKLLLAAQEAYDRACDAGADVAVRRTLADAYYDVRDGLGFNKDPDVYGAFPTDPYSHSPWERGARQPGMTGQVKEEILTRWGELGVTVRGGCVSFSPTMLPADEFLPEPATFRYVDLVGGPTVRDVAANTMAFTYCQVPVFYERHAQRAAAGAAVMTVTLRDGMTTDFESPTLTADLSRSLFQRSGRVATITVRVTDAQLWRRAPADTEAST